jgi:anthranilate phosphoribosyltransferase
MDIQQAVDLIGRYGHMQAAEAEAVMTQIMRGEATDAQIGAYLMGLRMKGETPDEITGSARAMRQMATRVQIGSSAEVLDTCGTGGDKSGTFNISTTVAFVAAGAGVPVAKHGNRASTSLCGSADVLAALGVDLDLAPEDVARSIDEIGIGFLFAPRLHPAMKYAMGPRRDLAVRTIFNILGPLTNPAGAQRQLMGVFAADLTDLMAHVLRDLGSVAAIVVSGYGGLDELTNTGPNRVSHLKPDGTIDTYELDPASLGLAAASIQDLRGGDAAHNARIMRGILDGSVLGPKRDVVLLNAGAALVAADRAETIADGMTLAEESVETGAALDKLERLIAFSRQIQ